MSCSNKWVPFPPLKNENPIWHFFDAVFFWVTPTLSQLCCYWCWLADLCFLTTICLVWFLFKEVTTIYIYVQFWKNPSICTRLSPCKYKVTSETYCFNIKCLLSYQPLVVVVEKTYALSILSICLACHKIYTDLIQKRRRKIFYFWKEPVLLSDNLIQV